MKINLTFKIVKPETCDYEKSVALAEEILREPLGLKFSQKELEEEKENIRIAGFFDNQLCVTAMLTDDGDGKFFMQRVAVKQELQGKGIGSELLKFCEEFLREKDAQVIYCHARDSFGRSAVNFYQKNEYFCADEQIIEDGIPHRMMWKILGKL